MRENSSVESEKINHNNNYFTSEDPCDNGDFTVLVGVWSSELNAWVCSNSLLEISVNNIHVCEKTT